MILSGVPAGTVFEVPSLAGSWERATDGLNHPHTHKRRPITFDHEVAKGRDDVVLAHLNHRLVQMCLRILRAEIWALDDRKTLHRVAVRRSTDPTLTTPVAIMCSRLAITGGQHHQLHEELTLAGGELGESVFTRIPQITRVEALMESSNPVEPDSASFDELRSRFERDKESLLNAIEARSRDRLKFLESTLEKRKKHEIDDISTILAELEKNLRNEVDDTKAIQLELWPENERQQLRRNVEAVQARLERLPEEREKEIEAINSRYSDCAHRTFPVSVTFILPTR